MSLSIKIGLAEDHGALRQGYVSLLRAFKNIEVLFDVGNGKDVLKALENSVPDILLLDLTMPLMSGQEVLKILKAKYPKLKIIIISGHFQKHLILECFRLGAKSFLRKEHKIEKIVEAIQSTFDTGGYIDNEVALMLASEISASRQKSNLTNHQIVVLKSICMGYTNKEIAKDLGVSVGAIKFHRTNIMDRTNSETVQDLIAFAILNGYIDPK